FEKFGNVWFYINGTGTERSGTYKINHEGPTAFEQMHKEEWLQLPFAQRAQFCSGPMALKACIYGNGFNEKHVLISGAKVIREAPIVVMKRTLMDRQTDTAKHVSILRRDRHAASTNLSVVE
ncbi:MAG: hypothetical protein KGH62_05185, partial [Candidatus Micrarchaeota archaeon]|nr:hypothetical protein [Candidatus Micrarchaeota archaeon]